MPGERIIPNQEAINLVKTRDESERQRVNKLADEIRVKRIFNPIDAVDQRNVETRARDVVRGLGGAESVEELYNITKDRNKTDAQKELAEQNIDRLGKAVFLVMNHGGRADLANRVLAGSQSVEEVLPEAFKGLGDAVVNQLIQSQEVRGILEEVDLVRSRVNFSDPSEVQVLVDEINEVKSRIIKIKVDPKYNQEVIMAKNYLTALKSKYEVPTSQTNPTPVVENRANVSNQNDNDWGNRRAVGQNNVEVVNAINKVVDKLPEKEDPRIKERESLKSQWDYWFSTLLHEAPRNEDPLTGLVPEWMKQDPDKALLQKVIQLANAAYFKKVRGGFSSEALFDAKGEALYGISNEIMQRLYERVPGVRECLEGFMQDFFVGGEENGQFVLKVKGVSEKRYGEDFKEDEKNKRTSIRNKFVDLRKLQLKMVDDLAGPGKRIDSGNLERDRVRAIKAVSVAWNLIYVGHTFEDADTTKCLAGEVVAPQAWNIMHPFAKAYDKFIKTGDKVGSEETFGGQKGQFLVRQVERSRFDRESRDLINAFKMGKIHPFPERLLTCFMVHTKVEAVGSYDRNGDPIYKKMPIAQALLEGKEINFLEGESGPISDPWGDYYDTASTSKTLYDLTTGKIPLVLEVNAGKAAKEMVDWANILGDARNKLKGNPLIAPHIRNKEFLLWSIVASVKGGVHMESPHLVMMTPKVFSEAQYDELNSLFMLKNLVETRADKEWVMRALNCESPGSVKRRKSITGQGGLLSLLGF